MPEALRARFGETIPSRLELLCFGGHIFPGFRQILAGLSAAGRSTFCTQLLGSRFITPDMALALVGAGLVALSELSLPWQKELREERRKRGDADEVWVRHTLAILDANIRSRCMSLSAGPPLPGPLRPIRALAEYIHSICLADWLETPAPGEWVRRLHAQKSACGSAVLWARASPALDAQGKALLLEHRSPRFQCLFKQECTLLAAPDTRNTGRSLLHDAWAGIIRDCLAPVIREKGYGLSRCLGELRESGLLTRQVLRLGFRDLVILTHSLSGERAHIYAELPGSLREVLQAWLSGEIEADFLRTRECTLEVRERFIEDGLTALILADQSDIFNPS